MNTNVQIIIKNISLNVIANFITLVISISITLIVPKLIGVEEYGFWQIFNFYSTYISFFHFGWIDGIYLRLGGVNYQNIQHKLYYSQFIQFFISQVIIAFIIFVISYKFFNEPNRVFVFNAFIFSIPLVNIRTFLQFILQATNQIEKFVNTILLDRIIYFVLISIILLLGFKNYKILIYCDIAAKIISLVYLTLQCKEVCYRNIKDFSFNLNEAKANISTGYKVMLAYVASILVIGIIRFGIEQNWDVSTFGRISLILSLSGMVMIFINAISIVVFPIIRKMKSENLSSTYSSIRDILTLCLLSFLIFYFPIKQAIAYWLPQYSQSLRFMIIVFPMILYEGRSSILVTPFLKALRFESQLLKFNIFSLILSVMFTIYTAFVIHNLTLTVFNIIIVLATRYYLFERFLAKELNLELKKKLIIEFILVVIFIVLTWYFDSIISLIIYIFLLLVYSWKFRLDFIVSYNNVKLFINFKSKK